MIEIRVLFPKCVPHKVSIQLVCVYIYKYMYEIKVII